MTTMLWCTCVCLLLVFPSWVSAAPDSQGTQFILGYMQNELPSGAITFKPNDVELFVTTVSNKPVTVTVTTPLYNASYTKTVIVHRGTTETVQIPHNIRGVGTEKSNKGVLITATDEISVYSVNKELKSTDAYISLPVDVLGKDYFVVTFKSKPELLVVGTEDNTQVNITCPISPTGKEVCKIVYNNSEYRSGHTLTLTLDKYETFHALGEKWDRADYTGVHITSSKPVSVVSGNKKVSVQGSRNNNSADHLTEMLMPVNTWGKTFILISTPDRSVGDIYRIVASENDTVVSLYNSSSYTINKAGNFLELDIPTGKYQTLISDKPVSVSLFAKTWRGPNDGPNFGDPAMSIIIPKAQYAADYTWSSVRDPKGHEFNNKVSVVIAKSKVGGLQLDGVRNINWIEQKDVLGSPDMVHLWANVTHGSHTLLHDDSTVTFMALVSGTYKVNSYAYLAGLRLADINVDGCSKTKPEMGDIVDNDCDGNVDEEKLNGIDDDGDGEIDEDLAGDSRGTFTCEVTGDPHLLTFNGKRSSVPIPCVLYRVATLRVNDWNKSGTPTFNKSVIEVDVLARNGDLPIRGQYFVSLVTVRVTFIKVNEDGTELREAQGVFTTGHNQIRDHRTGKVALAWTEESDAQLPARISAEYDAPTNMAVLSIVDASPKINFRPVNRSEGIPQSRRPGVTVEVGGDRIADTGAEFPNTLCSTVEDKVSPGQRALTVGLTENVAGLYSVLVQNTEQKLEEKYLKCAEVKGYYDDCTNKTSALSQCSPLLSKPVLVDCLDTNTEVKAFGAFAQCLNFVCQRDATDCAALRGHSKKCQAVSSFISLDC